MLGDTAALRRKYGRYLLWQRLNVDQVPLPFVNDMDKTKAWTHSSQVLSTWLLAAPELLLYST